MFEPVLPFTVTQNVITLAVTAGVAPPGATYTVPTAAAEQASTLNPVQVGSVPHPVANVVSIAKFQVRVSVVRLLGVGFVVAPSSWWAWTSTSVVGPPAGATRRSSPPRCICSWSPSTPSASPVERDLSTWHGSRTSPASPSTWNDRSSIS